MLDLGTSFVASVERDPGAVAIVDSSKRLSYREWYGKISALVGAFDDIGLRPGDHLVTVLQNNWQAATVHWACQFAGIIVTPVNWRAKNDEIDFYLENAEARAVAYQDVSVAAVAGARRAAHLPRIAISAAGAPDPDFAQLVAAKAADTSPRVKAEAWSLMLYTSGTTSRPKGVPRRHVAERAAAIAHVAQNLYASGERTLGVMPLYHTMGVRSLLAMSLVSGTFVCVPQFDAARALALITAERISNLYLVPTLYHDLVHHPDFAGADVRSVRQMVRVVRLSAGNADEVAATGEEGEIAALLAGDKSFEGYWRRPEADTAAIRNGWYFTGDTGRVDADGDFFVTGRVDDLIITGGENVSPVEIESCLSLHPAVAEVAVAGLPDQRWGKIVCAFVKRRAAVEAGELDAFCKSSGVANFKRPRRYEFVAEIPKSPVGKLLRRKLVAGEYRPESSAPQPGHDA